VLTDNVAETDVLTLSVAEMERLCEVETDVEVETLSVVESETLVDAE